MRIVNVVEDEIDPDKISIYYEYPSYPDILVDIVMRRDFGCDISRICNSADNTSLFRLTIDKFTTKEKLTEMLDSLVDWEQVIIERTTPHTLDYYKEMIDDYFKRDVE